MKNILSVFFVILMLSACVNDDAAVENNPAMDSVTPFSDRLTVSTIMNDTATVVSECPGKHVYLRSSRHGDLFLGSDDSTIYNLFRDVIYTPSVSARLQNTRIGSVNNPCIMNSLFSLELAYYVDLKFIYSGEVKEKLSDDEGGHSEAQPFQVNSIEKLSNCRVAYSTSMDSIPLLGTHWKMIGLVKNEVDTIFPPCEQQLRSLYLAENKAESYEGQLLGQVSVNLSDACIRYYESVGSNEISFVHGVCLTVAVFTSREMREFASQASVFFNGSTQYNIEEGILSLWKSDSPSERLVFYVDQ